MEKRKKKKRVMSILGKVYVVLLFLFISSGIPLLSPPIDQPLLYIFSTILPVTAYTDIQF